MIKPERPAWPLRPNPLRWVISGLLLTPGLAYANGPQGIEAVAGPAGTPLVDTSRPVPVVDIVPPTPQGISHNQFHKYNVGHGGVVLNNALTDGVSQLAGQLPGNSQLTTRAATTIFNEVTSLQLSVINGPQEIFGQAADYVLANPNGIFVNGASFINAPRASFVVGTPEFDKAGLPYLNTLHNDGLLEIGAQGLRNDHGAIALIAPRVEAYGSLDSPGKPLDILVGHNRIRYADSAVRESAQRSDAERRYDASLFGAMRAGRIRIVSTSAGAGVRLASPLIEADQGVQVRSAGELHFVGDRRDPNDIKLTRLDAGKGVLDLYSNGDMRLNAINAKARRIKVRTDKNLYLDATARETIEKDNEHWKRKAWFVTTETYDRERSTTDTRQLGSLFFTEGDMQVEAGNNATLRGAFVRADGQLRIKAGGELLIGAAIHRRHMVETVAHRKHLWRQDTRTEEIDERAERSSLSGGDIALQSGKTLRISGSTVQSPGDIHLKAPKVEIDTVALTNTRNGKDYRGDLVSGHFFGNSAKDGENSLDHVGSTVDADGKLIIETDGLAVTASTVRGKQDALLISEQEGVFIASAQNVRKVERSSNNSKLFGAFKDKNSSDREEVKHSGTEVLSDHNIRISSPKDVVFEGSKAIAGGKLDIEAAGDVLLKPVKDRTTEHTERTTHGFGASAGESKAAQDGKPGSKQYVAQVKWEAKTTETETVGETLQGSLAQGQSLTIKGGGKVVVDTSTIKTIDGDAQIEGKSVHFLSTDAKNTHTQDDSRTSVGMGVEGGIDRVGSATLIELENQRTVKESTEAGIAKAEINGDFKIIAENGQGLVEKQGADIKVAGTFNEQAGTVNNTAVHDTVSETTDSTSNTIKAGMSVEYKDITRPLEKVANEEEQTRLQQNGAEDAMDPPSLGIDIGVGHQQRAVTQTTRTARGTQVKAGAIELEVEGTLSDEGTEYEAVKGKVEIIANEHQLLAATHSTQTTLDRRDIDTSLRVDTVTGSDINVKLLGVGSSINKISMKETAVPGSLSGAQGIAIQLGTSGVYEGTRFNGGAGDVRVISDGALALPQANDHQVVDKQTLSGFGLAKGSTTPGAGKGAALLAKLEGLESHSEDTQGRAAQIDTAGAVIINTKGDMRLEGTRIGSAEQQPVSIDLQADGRTQVLASTDTHKASGQGMGGALQLGVSGNPTAGGKGASLGGAFTTSRVDEQAQTARGGEFRARDSIAIASAANADDAVQLQGLNAQGKALQVDARHGGVLIESAQSTDRRDNTDLAVGAGINGKSNPTDTGSNTSGIYGRVKLGLEQLDSTTHSNANLSADTLAINSAGDTRLAGAHLQAANINGKVGGDLQVETRQDQVDGLAVNVDLKLSREKNPQGLVNGVTSVAGPFGGKVREAAGARLSKIDPNITPTVAIDVVEQHRNTAGAATRVTGTDSIDLQVQGNTTLTGASLTGNRIDLGAGTVTKTDLAGQDYRAEGGVNGSNAPLDLVTGLKASFSKNTDNGVNLGLVRGGGHNERQTLKATVQQP